MEKFVVSSNGCWNWTDKLMPSGYGQVHFQMRRYRAHRLVFELLRGPIPKGLTLDHICRNRAYVNPDHLEPVTRGENVCRGGNTAKTHCPHGHAYNEKSFVRVNRDPRSRGWRRVCKVCAQSPVR